jgi:hypothetical protein
MKSFPYQSEHDVRPQSCPKIGCLTYHVYSVVYSVVFKLAAMFFLQYKCKQVG